MTKRLPRWSSFATGAVGVAVVVAFAFVLLRRPPAEPFGAGMNDWVGRPAPDFALQSLDGQSVTLSSLKGQVVVLDFWATWCPPCVAELPEVIAVAQKYADKGVAFYAVNAAESPETVRGFLDRKKLNPPVLLDTEMRAATAYDAQYIPLLVVIDASGRIVARDNVDPKDAARTLTRWIETARQSGQAK